MYQDCNYNMCYVVNGNKWTKIYNNKTRICDNKTLAAINREKMSDIVLLYLVHLFANDESTPSAVYHIKRVYYIVMLDINLLTRSVPTCWLLRG